MDEIIPNFSLESTKDIRVQAYVQGQEHHSNPSTLVDQQGSGYIIYEYISGHQKM